jgi:hypothetical protein
MLDPSTFYPLKADIQGRSDGADEGKDFCFVILGAVQLGEGRNVKPPYNTDDGFML